jgi:4-hydroxybenzoate polyprenyltransferase
LGAVCLVQSSTIQLQFDPSLSYTILVFFATLFVYNFQRVFYKSPQDNSLNSIRRKWILKNQITIKLLALVGFIGVLVCLFFSRNILGLLYLSPLLVLSLLYFLPFIKLRKKPLLKLLTLTLVWTAVTAVVPVVLNSTEPFTQNNLLHMLVRFCFMVAICIPFDIRDLQIDKTDSVFTIPHVLGENNARWLAFVCMLIYIGLIFLEFSFGILDLKVFLALLFSAIVNSVLVLMSSSKRNEYFYVAGLDGTMILQGVSLLIVYYFI